MHKDRQEKQKRRAAERVKSRIKAKTLVVTQKTEPAKCRGCSQIKELRENFCFDCLQPYL